MRPQIVGATLRRIAADPVVMSALFQVLETQKLIDGKARITIMPKGSALLGELLAAGGDAKTVKV